MQPEHHHTTPTPTRRIIAGVVLLLAAGWALTHDLPLLVAAAVTVAGVVILARGAIDWAVDGFEGGDGDDDGWDDTNYHEYWGVAGWPAPDPTERCQPRRPLSDEIEDWLRDNT